MPREAVLIIRHGALGDLIQSMGPIQAIRSHHPDACIVLLTTPAFRDLADACPWVDEVWLDDRPGWRRPAAWLALARRLRGRRFAWVYDLQTSSRSSGYARLFGQRRPKWSGVARGASHPHANPARDAMHTVDRQREQLQMAGIAEVPAPDLSWLSADTGRFALPQPFALLVPGGSQHRPEKRWPAAGYAALCARLAAAGIAPVLIGGPDEQHLNAGIATQAGVAVFDLAGRTSFAEIAALGRAACLAVGNDTGPMHLIAAVGCPSLVLFSAASEPGLCAPRGEAVAVLRQPDLAGLGVDEVWQRARTFAPAPPRRAAACE